MTNREKEAIAGADKLALKLNRVSAYVKECYDYYEQKYTPISMPTIVPEKFRPLIRVLGWATQSVNTLANKLKFLRFANADGADPFLFNEIFGYNEKDVLTDTLVLSALISSCSFVYISADTDGYPTLQAIDGGRATGVIDPRTRLLKEGYAVLERDIYGNSTLFAYFAPDYTAYIDSAKKIVDWRENPTGIPLLVPVCYMPSEVKPFGRSRITMSSKATMRDASLILLRAHCAGEFYSFPQKYVTGLDPELKFDEVKATYSSFLKLTQGENGDKAAFGQFQQGSMTPYLDDYKSKAAMFASENDLTMGDLGFATDNPATRESIEAAHEPLRSTAEKAQRNLGSGLKNAAYLAACLRDGQTYGRQILSDIDCVWAPIFSYSTSTLSGMGDAVNKMQQAFPEFFTEEKLKRLTGL